ncbi:hypothetical protein UFOVP325_87 [uncultured Caudovirales phage]|jgi:hypothetical protein|uniref:Uncharacterized protein n=1 Tax=uncultured Caudovirales phage TaxID=2100421 RepID=A0A6J5LTM0_9CAUD|nr:hypothetical protein UFOVP325_87 [uncultured Caudovirales phage]CAB4148038.1 hypothetical protein UFOVP430_82 [uncultured Caudovirales phage]
MDALWIIIGLVIGYVVVKVASILVDRADKKE